MDEGRRKVSAICVCTVDVSENSGTPKSIQIIHFNRVFHYIPSILGYPYFWKPPYTLPETKQFPPARKPSQKERIANRLPRTVSFREGATLYLGKLSYVIPKAVFFWRVQWLVWLRLMPKVQTLPRAMKQKPVCYNGILVG